MKPFNLEKALAGKPICTKLGLPARILDTNLKGRKRCVVVAILCKDGCEYIKHYFTDGKEFSPIESCDDLVMASEGHTGWINIYIQRQTSGDIYKTKEEALCKRSPDGYVDTIKITWEE